MKKRTTTKKTEKAINSGNEQAMPDFIGRLKAESEELTSRTGKLTAFLDGPVYRKLSPTMANLLQAQYHAMTAYQIILGMRLELLSKEGTKG